MKIIMMHPISFPLPSSSLSYENPSLDKKNLHSHRTSSLSKQAALEELQKLAILDDNLKIVDESFLKFPLLKETLDHFPQITDDLASLINKKRTTQIFIENLFDSSKEPISYPFSYSIAGLCQAIKEVSPEKDLEIVLMGSTAQKILQPFFIGNVTDLYQELNLSVPSLNFRHEIVPSDIDLKIYLEKVDEDFLAKLDQKIFQFIMAGIFTIQLNHDQEILIKKALSLEFYKSKFMILSDKVIIGSFSFHDLDIPVASRSLSPNFLFEKDRFGILIEVDVHKNVPNATFKLWHKGNAKENWNAILDQFFSILHANPEKVNSKCFPRLKSLESQGYLSGDDALEEALIKKGLCPYESYEKLFLDDFGSHGHSTDAIWLTTLLNTTFTLNRSKISVSSLWSLKKPTFVNFQSTEFFNLLYQALLVIDLQNARANQQIEQLYRLFVFFGLVSEAFDLSNISSCIFGKKIYLNDTGYALVLDKSLLNELEEVDGAIEMEKPVKQLSEAILAKISNLGKRVDLNKNQIIPHVLKLLDSHSLMLRVIGFKILVLISVSHPKQDFMGLVIKGLLDWLVQIKTIEEIQTWKEDIQCALNEYRIALSLKNLFEIALRNDLDVQHKRFFICLEFFQNPSSLLQGISTREFNQQRCLSEETLMTLFNLWVEKDLIKGLRFLRCQADYGFNFHRLGPQIFLKILNTDCKSKEHLKNFVSLCEEVLFNPSEDRWTDHFSELLDYCRQLIDLKQDIEKSLRKLPFKVQLDLWIALCPDFRFIKQKRSLKKFVMIGLELYLDEGASAQALLTENLKSLTGLLEEMTQLELFNMYGTQFQNLYSEIEYAQFFLKLSQNEVDPVKNLLFLESYLQKKLPLESDLILKIKKMLSKAGWEVEAERLVQLMIANGLLFQQQRKECVWVEVIVLIIHELKRLSAAQPKNFLQNRNKGRKVVKTIGVKGLDWISLERSLCLAFLQVLINPIQISKSDYEFLIHLCLEWAVKDGEIAALVQSKIFIMGWCFYHHGLNGSFISLFQGFLQSQSAANAIPSSVIEELMSLLPSFKSLDWCWELLQRLKREKLENLDEETIFCFYQTYLEQGLNKNLDFQTAHEVITALLSLCKAKKMDGSFVELIMVYFNRILKISLKNHHYSLMNELAINFKTLAERSDFIDNDQESARLVCKEFLFKLIDDLIIEKQFNSFEPLVFLIKNFKLRDPLFISQFLSLWSLKRLNFALLISYFEFLYLEINQTNFSESLKKMDDVQLKVWVIELAAVRDCEEVKQVLLLHTAEILRERIQNEPFLIETLVLLLGQVSVTFGPKYFDLFKALSAFSSLEIIQKILSKLADWIDQIAFKGDDIKMVGEILSLLALKMHMPELNYCFRRLLYTEKIGKIIHQDRLFFYQIKSCLKFFDLKFYLNQKASAQESLFLGDDHYMNLSFHHCLKIIIDDLCEDIRQIPWRFFENLVMFSCLYLQGKFAYEDLDQKSLIMNASKMYQKKWNQFAASNKDELASLDLDILSGIFLPAIPTASFVKRLEMIVTYLLDHLSNHVLLKGQSEDVSLIVFSTTAYFVHHLLRIYKQTSHVNGGMMRKLLFKMMINQEQMFGSYKRKIYQHWISPLLQEIQSLQGVVWLNNESTPFDFFKLPHSERNVFDLFQEFLPVFYGHQTDKEERFEDNLIFLELSITQYPKAAKFYSFLVRVLLTFEKKYQTRLTILQNEKICDLHQKLLDCANPCLSEPITLFNPQKETTALLYFNMMVLDSTISIGNAKIINLYYEKLLSLWKDEYNHALLSPILTVYEDLKRNGEILEENYKVVNGYFFLTLIPSFLQDHPYTDGYYPCFIGHVNQYLEKIKHALAASSFLRDNMHGRIKSLIDTQKLTPFEKQQYLKDSAAWEKYFTNGAKQK